MSVKVTCWDSRCSEIATVWYQDLGVYLGAFCAKHAQEFEQGLGPFAPPPVMATRGK